MKKLTGQDGIFMDLISPNNIYKGNSVLYTEFITRIGHRKELQSRGFERWPFVKAFLNVFYYFKTSEMYEVSPHTVLFGEISKKGSNCAKMVSFVVFVTTIRLKIL